MRAENQAQQTPLSFAPHRATATFRIESQAVRLLVARSLLARCVGLLNHLSLQEDEGLLIPGRGLFHTFGMQFPITVVGFDAHGMQSSLPRVVPPASLFWIPLRTKFVAEMHVNAAHRFPEAFLSENGTQSHIKKKEIPVLYGLRARLFYRAVSSGPLLVLAFASVVFLLSLNL